jgi:hypothetical protein
MWVSLQGLQGLQSLQGRKSKGLQAYHFIRTYQFPRRFSPEFINKHRVCHQLPCALAQASCF